MDIITLKMFLEENDAPLLNRPLGKIVDHQIHPHPWRDTKSGCQTESDYITLIHQNLLGRHFLFAIVRDWAEW